MLHFLFDRQLLELFGWVIIHSLWQGSVIALILYNLLNHISQKKSNLRYFTAFSALLLSLILPLITIWALNHKPLPGESKKFIQKDPMFSSLMMSLSRHNNSFTPIDINDENEKTRVVSIIQPDKNPESSGFKYKKHFIYLNRYLQNGKRWEWDGDFLKNRWLNIPLISQFNFEMFNATIKLILPYLSVLWVIGVLSFILWIICGLSYLQLLSKSVCLPNTHHLYKILNQLRSSLCIKNDVRLKVSPKIDIPMVVGIFRPIIYFPSESIDRYSMDELSIFIAHELAHVKRRDTLFNFIQLILESLLFFHPMVWWMSDKLRMEREKCCDDLALKVIKNPRYYAQILAKLADIKRGGHSFAMPLDGGELLTRIIRITTQGEGILNQKRLRQLILSSIFFMTVLLPVVAFSLDSIRLTLEKMDFDRHYYRFLRSHIDQPKLIMEGSALLKGKVLSSQSSLPITHGSVCLRPKKFDMEFCTHITKNGTFEFDGLAKGFYKLYTSRVKGYQILNYQGKESKYFFMSEGENRSGIELMLEPDFQISGRITDEKGNSFNSMDELGVNAVMLNENGVGYKVIRGRFTDDSGAYIIEGLGKGKAFIQVEKGSFVSVFYPSGFSEYDATPIFLSKKRFIGNIDIRVRKPEKRAFFGKVTDVNQKPIKNALVSVRSEACSLYFDVTDENGAYEIKGLSNGRFFVHLSPGIAGYYRRMDEVIIKDIASERELNFSLELGVLLSGIIKDEEGRDWQYGRNLGRVYCADCADSAKYYGIRPYTAFDSNESNIPLKFSTPSTFKSYAVRPGRLKLDFRPHVLNYEVKDIRLQGKSIMSHGINTRSGDKITGIEIIVGKKDK